MVSFDFIGFGAGIDVLAGIPDDLLLLFHNIIAIKANAESFDDFRGG